MPSVASAAVGVYRRVVVGGEGRGAAGKKESPVFASAVGDGVMLALQADPAGNSLPLVVQWTAVTVLTRRSTRMT